MHMGLEKIVLDSEQKSGRIDRRLSFISTFVLFIYTNPLVFFFYLNVEVTFSANPCRHPCYGNSDCLLGCISDPASSCI